MAQRTAGGRDIDLDAAEALADRLQTYADRLADAAGIRRAAAEELAHVRSARDAALAEAENLRAKVMEAEQAACVEREARIEAERRAARVIAERDAAIRVAEAAEARASAAEHGWRIEILGVFLGEHLEGGPAALNVRTAGKLDLGPRAATTCPRRPTPLEGK